MVRKRSRNLIENVLVGIFIYKFAAVQGTRQAPGRTSRTQTICSNGSKFQEVWAGEKGCTWLLNAFMYMSFLCLLLMIYGS